MRDGVNIIPAKQHICIIVVRMLNAEFDLCLTELWAWLKLKFKPAFCWVTVMLLLQIVLPSVLSIHTRVSRQSPSTSSVVTWSKISCPHTSMAKTKEQFVIYDYRHHAWQLIIPSFSPATQTSPASPHCAICIFLCPSYVESSLFNLWYKSA